MDAIAITEIQPTAIKKNCRQISKILHFKLYFDFCLSRLLRRFLHFNYLRGYCIMAIMSAFQAEDTGSTPVTRSNINN